MAEIFTLTALSVRDNDFIKDSRCFGYAPDEATARAWAAENRADMVECRYNFLVIESVAPGIHARAVAVQWYVNLDGFGLGEGAWTPIDPPDWSRGVVNYSMG